MKLMLLPAAVEGTTTLGYPAFVILPLGIVQAICLALYVVPRTSVLRTVLWTGHLGVRLPLTSGSTIRCSRTCCFRYTWHSCSGADCSSVTGGSLTDALRDQLGLRLNRTETPTTFVVIDSAEKPTPN